MRRPRPLLSLGPTTVEGPPARVVSEGFTDRDPELPPAVDFGAGETFVAAFSGEQLWQVDGDALAWGDVGDYDAHVRALPLRPRLDVVKGGEVFLDEQENGAASFGTVLSLPALLDTLVPERVAAVDGDPATAVPTRAPQAG